MVFSPIAHLASLLVLSATFSQLASAQSLRNSNFKDPKGEECTIIVQSQLRLDEDDGVESESFDCVLDAIDADGVDGHSVPIDVTKQQRNILKKLFKDGDIISDESTLKMESGFKLSKNGVHIPKNKDKFNFGKKKGGKENARRLAVVTGVKPILVVRVTDSDGLVRSESASVIGDDIFGTNGDTMTLKSQMYDCSFGQLNITAGLLANPDHEAAPGVVEVDINVSFNNPRSTVRNAVTTAVQAKLGITLPGPYQQVMYVLEGCYQDCGWAAYAYVNSWMSVYQGNFYKMVGVQMHEIGHNFNFAHSGGLDGQTYTDHTGLMGNPLYSDDVGAMCWNAAKTWQVGWYDSSKISISPQVGQLWTETIVGIADFNNNSLNHPVVVKIETGTATDQFIAFNRATGVNRQNDEADNEVTIVETGRDGEGYSQSFLKATLQQGETFVYANWAGTNQNLSVTAETIITNPGNNDPGYAVVTACLGECTQNTPAPTVSPSRAPTAGPTVSPTSSPSKAPTAGPTKSPSASPTEAPTRSPTTSPTVGPTSSPTEAPTRSPTTSPTSSPSTVPSTARTISPTTGPTQVPTSGPTASPTKNPTLIPTAGPTPNPTAGPTPSPTASLTSNPTASPTAGPTTNPTKRPSSSPTAGPTSGPTANPSTSPTSSPTSAPTSGPTPSPTKGPSLSPTATPTASPTTSPTAGPTANPTTSPTKGPSLSPTAAPTASPTASPTEGPTLSPTKGPTSSPTAAPTANPTVSPTKGPTSSPTAAPTASPTATPSLNPTKDPSLSPTANPTPVATSNPTPAPTPSASVCDGQRNRGQCQNAGTQCVWDNVNRVCKTLPDSPNCGIKNKGQCQNAGAQCEWNNQERKCTNL